MKSWCLPNLGVQIAVDCILAYLNFQHFLGGTCPRIPLVSRAFGTHYWCCRANVIHIFLVMPYQGKIPGASPAFLTLVSSAEKRALAIPSWETISVTLEFLNQSWISSYIFVEQRCVGFTWGCRVQWPTVTMSKIFLEGVINHVDPMGFLGGKERIRIPINSKHSSLEVLKRHWVHWFESWVRKELSRISDWN